jgi:photosystem II stability/assembly factor-like uncharacterized protein
MKRYFAFIAVAVAAALLLAGCIGSGGSAAPAPTGVNVVAKDSRVIVTWDMVPGVQYWVFGAVGDGVTPQNCASKTCGTAVNVTSPAVLWRLGTNYLITNGTQYSFSVNARTNGGPGGPGSAAVTATPRISGDTWVSSAAPTTNALRGVAYGVVDSKFVAAGDLGTLLSSTDGKTWATLNSPTTANFNAVSYDTSYNKYQAVGAGGMVYALSPGSSTPSTWVAQTSNTTKDLFAVARIGATSIITGAAGTIITSVDGATTWSSPQTTNTTNALRGATYGYSSTLGNVFVVVGDAGTVLHSADGSTWTPASSTSGVTASLKSVTAGYGVFIAVGDGGTVLTSPDAETWTLQLSTSIPSAAALNSVTYLALHRFMAVSNNGNIYYSDYANLGATWTAVTPQVTTSPLNTIVTGVLNDYAVVGADGTNLYSD